MFTRFEEVFVPIFVAMSPLTALPVYLSVTEGMQVHEMRALSRKAIVTAFCVAVGVMVAGRMVFRLMGIQVNDLRIGGGLILLIIAIYDVILSREQRKRVEMPADFGVVPLGTPLIVGPATMTTCLVLADTHGRLATLASLVVNLGLTALMLHYAHLIKEHVPAGVTRAFGKVMSLFLAAIAVGTMRAGIASYLTRQ